MTVIRSRAASSQPQDGQGIKILCIVACLCENWRPPLRLLLAPQLPTHQHFVHPAIEIALQGQIQASALSHCFGVPLGHLTRRFFDAPCLTLLPSTCSRQEFQIRERSEADRAYQNRFHSKEYEQSNCQVVIKRQFGPSKFKFIYLVYQLAQCNLQMAPKCKLPYISQLAIGFDSLFNSSQCLH